MPSALNAVFNELKNFALFKDFDQNALADLCENGSVKIHDHKQVVFSFGEPATHFGVVISGAYKLSRISPAGEESVVHFSSPGDVVATLIMPQKNGRYPVNVKAMGPSRIIIMPRETYMKSWIINPGLMAKMQGLMTTRMTRLQNQKIMQRSPMSSKISSMLLQLVAEDKMTESQLEVPLPLTRKEIADSLGVTVESVIRVMSEWGKLGIIQSTDHHIVILKPDHLIRLMEEQE